MHQKLYLIWYFILTDIDNTVKVAFFYQEQVQTLYDCIHEQGCVHDAV